MAVKYTLNGIEYNDVKTRGKEYQPIPPLVSDTIYNCNTEDLQESFNGGSIPTIVNAIEIDWNDAYLQRNNKSLNNTSDLLNILDNTIPAELFDEYIERIDDAYNSSYNYIQKASTLEHTIDNLKSTITYIESDVSGVKQSMGSIIEQSASGISTRVTRLESQYGDLSGIVSEHTSRIDQTADQIQAAVATIDVTGIAESVFTISSTDITSRVSALEYNYDNISGTISTITQSEISQAADNIKMSITQDIMNQMNILNYELIAGSNTWVISTESDYTITNTSQTWGTSVRVTKNGNDWKFMSNDDNLPKAYLLIPTTTGITKQLLNNTEYSFISIDAADNKCSQYDILFNLNELMQNTLSVWVDSSSKTLSFEFVIPKDDEATEYETLSLNIQLIKNPKGANGSSTVDPINIIELNPIIEKAYVNANGKMGFDAIYALKNTYVDNNGHTSVNTQYEDANIKSDYKLYIETFDVNGNTINNEQIIDDKISTSNHFYKIEEVYHAGVSDNDSYYDLEENNKIHHIKIYLYINNSETLKRIDERIIDVTMNPSSVFDMKIDAITLAVQGSVSGISGVRSSLELEINSINERVEDLNGNYTNIRQDLDTITSEVHDSYNGLGALSSRITQTATDILSEVHDSYNGLNSRITQTATDILSEVNDSYNGLNSRITQTATDILSEVNDLSGSIGSRIAQSISGIEFEVHEARGSKSTLKLALDGINAEVSDVSGNVSTLTQNSNYIAGQVSGAMGEYSTLLIAISGIASEVAGTSGMSSLIAQTATGIHASVVSGLSRTGIDIENQQVNINSDNFKIVDNNGDLNMYINNRGDLYVAGNISNKIKNIETYEDWIDVFIPVSYFHDINTDNQLIGSMENGYPIQTNLAGVLPSDPVVDAIDVNIVNKNPKSYMMDLERCNKNINIYPVSGIVGNTIIYLPFFKFDGDSDNGYYISNVTLNDPCLAWRLAPRGHKYNGCNLFENSDNEVSTGSYSKNNFTHNCARGDENGENNPNFAHNIFTSDYSLYFNLSANITADDLSDVSKILYSTDDMVITNNSGSNLLLKSMSLYYYWVATNGVKGNDNEVTDTTFNNFYDGNTNTEHNALYFYVKLKVNNGDNDFYINSNPILFAISSGYSIAFLRTLTKYGNQNLHYYTYNELNEMINNRFILRNNTNNRLFVVYNPEIVDSANKFKRYNENTDTTNEQRILNSAYVSIPANASLGFTLVKEINEDLDPIPDSYNNDAISGCYQYYSYIPKIYCKPDYSNNSTFELSNASVNSLTFGNQVYFTN